MSSERLESYTKDHNVCLRCGRKLKNKRARIIGYGAVCEKKMKTEISGMLFKIGKNEQKEKPLD